MPDDVHPDWLRQKLQGELSDMPLREAYTELAQIIFQLPAEEVNRKHINQVRGIVHRTLSAD